MDRKTEVFALAAGAHQKKEYRPVAVAVIQDSCGRYLFVQSVKDLQEWSFPQGGIEVGEDAEEALSRELQEELGIVRSGIARIVYLGNEDMDAESARKDKRGFTRGKRYFFFLVTVQNPSQRFTPQRGEIADYRWVATDEVNQFLATTRATKRLLMLKYLALVSESSMQHGHVHTESHSVYTPE